jgi:hypothetical protein
MLLLEICSQIFLLRKYYKDNIKAKQTNISNILLHLNSVLYFGINDLRLFATSEPLNTLQNITPIINKQQTCN